MAVFMMDQRGAAEGRDQSRCRAVGAVVCLVGYFAFAGALDAIAPAQFPQSSNEPHPDADISYSQTPSGQTVRFEWIQTPAAKPSN